MITDELVEAAAQAIWKNCPFDLLDRPSEHHRDYARAALAAVLPMVVAKCAGVAQERVRINRRAALTCINGSREKMRLLDEANGAESIERAILALATTSEGETT